MSLDDNKKVGFLIHPRNYSDFYKAYPSAKILPQNILERVMRTLPPLKVSKITGLQDTSGKNIGGYVLGIPLTAHTMLEHRQLAKEKIAEAVEKAEDLNIGILALGGLTASLSKGGLDIASINNVGVTTGRAYTVKTVSAYVERVCEKFQIDKKSIRVGVVGAAGSIGAGCTYRLTKKGYTNFHLIDLERKLHKVENHVKELADTQKDLSITIDHQLHTLSDTHMVIAATNAPEALITKDDIRPGTFVINDAQPSDVSQGVFEKDEVAVIEGGIISTPGVSCNIDMGIHGKNNIFCCLAEALILAKNKQFKNFSTGHLSLENITKLEQLSKSVNFNIPDFQNENGFIQREKLQSVASKLHERIH